MLSEKEIRKRLEKINEKRKNEIVSNIGADYYRFALRWVLNEQERWDLTPYANEL